MTDGEGLRRAIVSDPDDDTPRLIYADWLEEHSRPERAAFIRAQVEAARAEPFSPAARAAAARAAAVGDRHHDEWTKHLRPWTSEARFVRGFVGHVAVEAVRFEEVAGRVFEYEPVESVRAVLPAVGEGRGSVEPFFEVPKLRRVRSLDLSAQANLYAPAHLVHFEFEAFLASPHLDGLRDLSVRGNPVPLPWIDQLFAGDRLPALAGLCLADITNLGPRLAAAAARSARRFARLDISGVAFPSSDDLHRLLTSRCLREVEEVRLGWDARMPGSPGALSRLNLGWVLPWAKLRVLDLTGQGVGSEGAREIARLPDAARLRWLGLARNHLGPEGARLLAASRHLNLYYLDVRDNGLTDADRDALRHRFPDAEVVG